MQISRIKWLNIMGLENLTIEPGKLTVVKGPNAAGKSSMAAGIASILDGGAHEAKLLRNGTTEGQIVFELDDGSSIEKRIREDGSDIKVRNEKGKVVAKPATVVQSLLNKASANPIAFFTAEKEDRKKILLKAMPIKADPERIKSITGQVVTASGNAWDVLAAVEKTAREERRYTNVAIDQKSGAITQLEQALPASAGETMDVESITEEIAKLDALRDEKLGKIATTLQKFRDKHKADSDALNEANEAAKQDIQAETDEATKGARAEIARLMEKVHALEDSIRETESAKLQKLSNLNIETAGGKSKLDDELADYERRATEAKTARNAEWQQARGACDLQLKEARANIEAQGRIKQSMDNLAAWREELAELKTTQEAQNKSITDLAEYRIELMQSLPIPGLEVKGDDIYYHGVVWEGLNEAKRMELAFEIALLQCGEVPFLFVDGAERLDGKNFEIFKARVQASKAQCMMFAVDHDPEATGLTIEDVV